MILNQMKKVLPGKNIKLTTEYLVGKDGFVLNVEGFIPLLQKCACIVANRKYIKYFRTHQKIYVMKIYKVGIWFQCYDSQPEIAIKYFTDENKAGEYYTNLAKFIVRATRIYKKLYESINRLEKLIDAGQIKSAYDIYHKRYDAILKGPAYYFKSYEGCVFRHEFNISDNTDIELQKGFG